MPQVVKRSDYRETIDVQTSALTYFFQPPRARVDCSGGSAIAAEPTLNGFAASHLRVEAFCGGIRPCDASEEQTRRGQEQTRRGQNRLGGVRAYYRHRSSGKRMTPENSCRSTGDLGASLPFTRAARKSSSRLFSSVGKRPAAASNSARLMRCGRLSLLLGHANLAMRRHFAEQLGSVNFLVNERQRNH